VVLSRAMEQMRRVARGEEQVLCIANQLMGRTDQTHETQRGAHPIR